MSNTGWTPVPETPQAAPNGWTPVDEPAPAQKPGFLATAANEIGKQAMGAARMFTQPLEDAKNVYLNSRQAGHGVLTSLLLAGMAPQAMPDIRSAVDSAQQWENESKAGYSTPYKVGAQVASKVGVDVPAMEQAAKEGNTRGVLAQAAVPAAEVAAIPAVAKGASALGDLVPSTARAGAALSEVKSAAGDIPIDMTKPGRSALELYTQSQRGATLPKVVRDFVNRATRPDSAPITYAEAKDFQSNISRLSANERMNMNPNTQRLLGRLNADLKDSLSGAADIVGKGEQFDNAMKEYHQAAQLKGYGEAAKRLAVKGALTAGGYGLGYKLLHALGIFGND